MISAATIGRGRSANMSDNYSADTIKSVISHLDLLVGSRFHSIVFALAAHVPAVVLGWAHKYVELMRLTGLERFVLEHDQLDPVRMQDLLKEAWKNTDHTRKILSERVPGIQKQVDVVFDHVASLIQDNVN